MPLSGELSVRELGVALGEAEGGLLHLHDVEELFEGPERERGDGDDGRVAERHALVVPEVRRRLEREAAQIEADEEQLVRGADNEQNVRVRVVQLEQLALGADLLVARGAAVQRRVHVHVVRGEVERHEQLEHHDVLRVGDAQIADQCRRRAPVGHHVEDGAELGRLAEAPRCCAVERVKQARHAVQRRAVLRVPLHEHEREQRERDARVPDQIGHVQEHPAGRHRLHLSHSKRS